MKKILFILIATAIYLNSFSQFKVYSYGMVDITTQTQDWWPGLKVTVATYNSTAYNLWYNGSGRFFAHASGYIWCEKGGYFGSDISLKENIRPIENALQKVLNLNGVRFQYKERSGEEENPNNPEHFRLGFIAQEVEIVFPEVIKNMPDGKKAMSYTDLIAVLVEAIKAQQAQIEDLQMMVATYCKQNPDLTPPTNFLNNNDGADEGIGASSVDENTLQGIENAKLFQNLPNPFSMNTEIRFEIPYNTTSAKLLIHDMQGTEIKSYNIIRGVGSVVIQGSELQAGMYMYTLLVNNKIVDTKKMILAK
ncbi:MAG: tail fiber domain-containing protein [Bacteroidales bacterium]|jgi:hypothetical protein|nr:tail fiber domain-containing protein [Bacteroidales bacterium]